MVSAKGLELLHHLIPEPKSGSYANSDTFPSNNPVITERNLQMASYAQISYYGFHASNTEGTHHIWANDVAVAADAEFESTLSESKSDVLPLHQSAIL